MHPENSYSSLFDIYKPYILADWDEVLNNNGKVEMPVFHSSMIIDFVNHVGRMFLVEPTMLDLPEPITIVGDLHGSFLDLVHILLHHGLPPKTKYLFLGDYVDRGQFSLETLMAVYILKATFPNYVFLIRGNHEFEIVCSKSNFMFEISELYGQEHGDEIFQSILVSFDKMPIAARISNKILCIHGGIGPNFHDLSDLDSIHRPIHDFSNDTMIDILWSDPNEICPTFAESRRGMGYFFGEPVFEEFLEANQITTVIRGHECVYRGIDYKFARRLITVFSSTDVVGHTKIEAGTIVIDNGGIFPHRFPQVPLLLRNDVKFVYLKNPLRLTSSCSEINFDPTAPIARQRAAAYQSYSRAPLVLAGKRRRPRCASTPLGDNLLPSILHTFSDPILRVESEDSIFSLAD